jgi:hypothetical protein
VKGLLKHFLADADGIRAIIRVIKNILDYNSDARLRTFYRVLNAYRERILKEKEAAISKKAQIYEVRIQPRKKQQRRKKLKD